MPKFSREVDVSRRLTRDLLNQPSSVSRPRSIDKFPPLLRLEAPAHVLIYRYVRDERRTIPAHERKQSSRKQMHALEP